MLMKMKLGNNNKFFIKKGNNFPLIKFILSEEIMRFYGISEDMLSNVAITFSMINKETGNFVIANEPGEITLLEEYKNSNNKEYCLSYQLTIDDTQEIGKYEGEFVIDFLESNEYKIGFPVNNKIEIIITDSITTTTVI